VIGVTFDNLGEVADLQRGTWPEEAPLGRHASVTRTLPRILDLLAELGVRATFFVEGLNTELYPDALREIDAGGHELAYHGWRHERWSDLDPAAERASLERGVGALDALGLRPVGFRPPGGDLTPATVGLLRELGFAYCSPAGEAAERRDAIAVVPFRWPLVDAYHYLPHFGPLRGRAEPLPPSRLRAEIDAGLDGGAVLIFHPFLLDSAERFAVLRHALERARELGAATCRELAAAL
jgi:peptidoglycan/xylan/chitin deacetylase (PgdA/CDA1 family)